MSYPATQPQPQDIWPSDCSAYWQLTNQTERCQFVLNSEACFSESGLIAYLSTLVCHVPDWAKPLYLVACGIWLLFLFGALATTADNFFCPSLTVMSANLRMSHNLAGVTLLAFGNGAPDIFSSLAAITQSGQNGDESLAFGALLGAGVFVTTVVAGSVAAAHPFKAMERPLLKDMTFYLAALWLTFFSIYRGFINLAVAIAFLGLYIFYVLVTLIARYIRKYHRPPRSDVAAVNSPDVGVNYGSALLYGETSPLLNNSYVADELISARLAPGENINGSGVFSNGLLYTVRYAIHHKADRRYDLDDDSDDEVAVDHSEVRRAQSGPGALSADVAVSRSLQSVDLNTPQSISPSTIVSPASGSSMLLQLLHRLAPIDATVWRESSLAIRLLELFKAPFLLPLTIAIPIVDDELPMRGWCRLLNCLQLMIGPIVCLLASNQYSVAVPYGSSVLLLYICAPVLAFVALLALYFTRSDRPPVWHDFLAWLAFVTAVCVIYLIANEVVALLQAFGVLLNVSKAILGLTLLAWGNSIGDMISNVALARRGYPRMAISACFGGPMFNLLCGVGLSFTWLIVKQNSRPIKLLEGQHDYVLLGSLAVSLLFSLVYCVARRFQLGRLYASAVFAVYAAFLTMALLVELRVVRLDR